MILAAADYATGKEDATPPPELSDYFKCELFSSLPNGRGWKNESYKWTQRVTVYVNYYNACKGYSDAMSRLKGKDRSAWIKSNKAILRMVNRVEKLRGAHG